MTSLREAATQALEALEHAPGYSLRRIDAMDALRAALAEPVQEPCSNCASLQDQNTELDRKLKELDRKSMNEFDALRLITESIGRLQSSGPVDGLIGIIRAVERAHGIS